MNPHSERLGVWLAVGAAVGFSAKAILVKLAYAFPGPTPVAPVTLLALRMAYSLPAFIWIALRTTRHAAPLSGGDRLAIIGLGLIGYYGASIFDFLGLQYISAGLERLILFTYPTLTLLLGILLFGQRITRREIGALALCYLGIAAAFSHDLKLAGDAHTVWLGASLVFASSLTYAGYLVGGGRMITRLGAARFTALAMLVSTTATLLHFALTQPLPSLVDQPWPIHAYGFAMALFSTVLPVFAMAAAMRRIGAGRAALISTLGPLMTIFLGWAVLDEHLSLIQMAGTALVIGGVWIVGRR
jgi:drug/metabolite transporter (DMT)-like permease